MNSLERRMNEMALVDATTEDNTEVSEARIIDGVIQDFECIHIRSSGDCDTDAKVSRLPIIPLEVVQHFSTDYFDDEDFIYQDFVLPECIVDAIQDYQRETNGGEYSMEPYHSQVASYLICRYMELSETADNAPIFPILRRVITLFESMIHYYTVADESGPDCVDANNIYDFVIPGFEQMLYITATAIEENIQLNPTSDEYITIHRYSQEVLYGLGLIIDQIKRILETYVEKLGIRVIADGMHQRHIKRLFRLTNNMCIIMIFFFLVHDEALENCDPDQDPDSNMLNSQEQHNVAIDGYNWQIGEIHHIPYSAFMNK